VNQNPTQAREVLEYMEKNGSITILQAVYDLQITRLSARIREIVNKMGIPVKSESVRVKKKNGKYTRVARYSLA
jgi:hypothetical protein